jgi:plasmid stability protein
VASLTIRNIPEDAKLRFRQVAAAHGRSMEEHLRQMVLSAGVANEAAETKGVRDVTQSFRHLESDPKAKSRGRIERLIKLGRGVDWQPEPRTVEKLREIDFG